MPKREKHLCKYEKKEISDHLDYLLSIVRSPVYMCEKCVRTANTDQVLCKPFLIGTK
ncbi:MAG: hypothetical protein WC341_18215 [Bacteroidales bacterium]|jgi:hypothetical protein